MGKRSVSLGVAVAVLVLASCGNAAADSFVVDGSSVGGHCSDARSPNQVSVTTPWCSIARAVEAAPSGSTVAVRAGSYPYQQLHGLGTRTDYVTIEPFRYGTPSAESVTIAGVSTANTSYLRFRGLHLVGDDATGFRPAARIYLSSDHIELIDNDMRVEGIYLQGATNVLMERNHIHDVVRNCAITSAGDGGGIFVQRSSDVRILRNRIDGTIQDSLNFGRIPNLLVDGNVMSNASYRMCGDHTDLVQIEGGAAGPMTFTNNVFHDGGQFVLRNAVGLTIANNLMLRVHNWMHLVADPGARIVNNTWWGGNQDCPGCGTLMIRQQGPAGFNYTNDMRGSVFENNIMRVFIRDGVPREDYIEDHNIIYGPPSLSSAVQGAHTLMGTPSFVDAAADNLRLSPGSLGIDAGDAAVAPTTDLFGSSADDDPSVPDTGAGPVSYRDVGAIEGRTGPAAGPWPRVDPTPPGGDPTPPGDPVPPGGNPKAPAGEGPGPTVVPPAPSVGPTSGSTAPSTPNASRRPRLSVRTQRDPGGKAIRLLLRCSTKCRVTVTGRITSRRPAHESSNGARSPRVKRYPLERKRARVGSAHGRELRMWIPKRARRMATQSGHRVLRVVLHLTARGADGTQTARTIRVRLRVPRTA